MSRNIVRTNVIVTSLLRQEDKKPPSGQSQMDDMHEQLLLREVRHKKVITLKSHASAEFGTAAWSAAASDTQPVETLLSITAVHAAIIIV